MTEAAVAEIAPWPGTQAELTRLWMALERQCTALLLYRTQPAHRRTCAACRAMDEVLADARVLAHLVFVLRRADDYVLQEYEVD